MAVSPQSQYLIFLLPFLLDVKFAIDGQIFVNIHIHQLFYKVFINTVILYDNIIDWGAA